MKIKRATDFEYLLNHIDRDLTVFVRERYKKKGYIFAEDVKKFILWYIDKVPDGELLMTKEFAESYVRDPFDKLWPNGLDEIFDLDLDKFWEEFLNKR